MLKKISLIFSFFTLFFVISNTTKASFIDNKLYIGGGLGIPTNDLKIYGDYYDGLNNTTQNYSSTYKANPLINIFLGYDVIKFFAIEGEFNYSYKDYNTADSNNSALQLEHKEYYISTFINLIGKYQTKYGTPFIKLGFGYMNINRKLIEEDKDTLKDINNFISLKIGTGYEYTITQHHIVGLEYNYEHNINNSKRTFTFVNENYPYTENTFNYINQYIKLTYKYKF